MGLSRNKVAVSEGAAGSPPFYGDREANITEVKLSARSRIRQKPWQRCVFVSTDRVCCSIVRLQSESERYTHKNYGGVAQLGEHLPCKQGVKGSIPFISTIFVNGYAGNEKAVDEGRKANTAEWTEPNKPLSRTVCSSGG